MESKNHFVIGNSDVTTSIRQYTNKSVKWATKLRATELPCERDRQQRHLWTSNHAQGRLSNNQKLIMSYSAPEIQILGILTNFNKIMVNIKCCSVFNLISL